MMTLTYSSLLEKSELVGLLYFLFDYDLRPSY